MRSAISTPLLRAVAFLLVLRKQRWLRHRQLSLAGCNVRSAYRWQTIQDKEAQGSSSASILHLGPHAALGRDDHFDEPGFAALLLASTGWPDSAERPAPGRDWSRLPVFCRKPHTQPRLRALQAPSSASSGELLPLALAVEPGAEALPGCFS